MTPADLRAIADTLESCEWHHPLLAAQRVREAAARIEAIEKAFARSPYDISPCMVCGEPVVTLPDGLPMCDPCADRAFKAGIRRRIQPERR